MAKYIAQNKGIQQLQEYQTIEGDINTLILQRHIHTHTIFKLLKTRDKYKIFKSEEKAYQTEQRLKKYSRLLIRSYVRQKQWNDIF